jgi:DUF4097 and DUF4098 domain-containing protein YvlB
MKNKARDRKECRAPEGWGLQVNATKTHNSRGALWLALLAGLVASSGPVLGASDQAFVKRGEPQREGRQLWTERAQCGAPAHDGGRLILRTDFGSILVKTGQNDRLGCQVRLQAYTADAAEARRYFGSFELTLRSADGTSYLTGKSVHERHRSLRMNAEFLIVVPAEFNLDMETQAGDVDVERLEGELRARTAGGDIRTGDVSGPVKVGTAGGSIALGNIGQRLEASTAGGNIRVGSVRGNANLDTDGGEIVAGRIEGEVRARTAGGDIVLRGASGPVIAQTAGGQIQIGDCGGTVRAETDGGNIRLAGARGMVNAESAGGSIHLFRLQSAVRANTAAGPILAEINANRESFAPSHLGTAVGDVMVFLPPDLPLNIEAVIDEAAGHKIFSEFPLTIQGQREFWTGTVHARCALNGGGKQLAIHAAAGNIEIRKLDSQVLDPFRQRQQQYWRSLDTREQLQTREMVRKLQRAVEEELRRSQREMQDMQPQLDKLRKQPRDDDGDNN